MTSGENQPRPARERGAGGRGGGGMRRGRQKVCQYCVDKVKSLDYKDVGRIRTAVTEHGKMKTRRLTGTCARHQRQVAEAVKRARHMALLPFVSE